MSSQNVDPSTPSSAYKEMCATWQRIDDILAGPDCIRKKNERYLPKYEAEDAKEYARRLQTSPWRPEFDDILRTLASKPFGKDVALVGSASEPMKALAEDIDGCGNNLTAFARTVFRGGIARGMHAILVDYPTMSQSATLADERASGARPYWVSIKADDILALYTTFVNGREVVTHVRLKERETVRDGFDEVCIDRVRILEPGRWELWENRSEDGYQMIANGVISLPQVPLALFWTGERQGSQQIKPPLNDLADMQIELYRALSRHEETLTYAGSPMLQGRGIAAPREGDTEFAVGPKRILFAPPGVDGGQTGWDYVSPDASTLDAGAAHIDKIQADMRRLGMQPLTQMTGTVTATSTSVEAAKAHSTVQAWALNLKDVLEQAFVFTAQWMNQADSPEVEVSTDFSVVPFAQAPLQALKEARASRDIDQETYLNGLKRFDVLAPDSDVQAIIEAVANEAPDAPTEADLAAALGQDLVDPQQNPAA